MTNAAVPFTTQRLLNFSASAVYGAFADPALLARWWGPDGFTNQFHRFDFSVGGEWLFDMLGPDGQRYANHNRFVELVPHQRVVIQHLSAPRFVLTVELSTIPDQTLLSWVQAFEDEAVAQAVAHIVVPANEQNLDRLTAVLSSY
jgi:uncharacterized protein YndB with AHSA1/START domain